MIYWLFIDNILIQKQPPIGVPRKRCSENMQQIYRRTPLPKCNFNKVALHQCQSVISIKLFCSFIEIALRLKCSPVNLPHYFRTPFPKNTSEGLLLSYWQKVIQSLQISMDRLCRLTASLQNQKYKIQSNVFENIFETAGH